MTPDSEHQRFPTRSVSDPEQIRQLAIDAARLLSDDKCEDVLCLDVRSLSQLSDYIIIGTGSSDRQMRSAADDVADLAQTHNYPIFKRSQDDRATWIVLDCVDVVVHIFEPNTRAHYDLEMLWGDAKPVDWSRPAPGKAPASKAVSVSTSAPAIKSATASKSAKSVVKVSKPAAASPATGAKVKAAAKVAAKDSAKPKPKPKPAVAPSALSKKTRSRKA